MNRFFHIFLTCLVVVFIGIAQWLAFTRFGSVMLLAVLTVPIGIFFLNHQKLLFMLVFMTLFSGMGLPGMPGGLLITHLLAALYLGITISGKVFSFRLRTSIGVMGVIVILFLCNLVLIILVRGAGFRVLGDANWGGIRYIHLFLAGIFLLNVRNIRLSNREWMWTIFGMLLMSLLPMLAEMVFILSGGRIQFQYYLIRLQTGTVRSFFTSETGGELVRFQSAHKAGVNICLLALLLFYAMRIKWVWALLVFSFGFLLGGISGHRSTFIEVVMMIWLFGLFQLPVRKAHYILISILLAVFSIPLLYIIAPYLPLTLQRTISFFPGISISYEAMTSAQGTMNWRLDLWLEALQELKRTPSYLLIGKGFTYPWAEYTALLMEERPSEVQYWWGVITSTYHSGPLSLLVGMGIPGFLIGSGLLVGYPVRCYRVLRNNSLWSSDISRRFFAVFWVHSVAMVMIYFLIYGDVFVSFPPLLFRFALLEGLIYCQISGSADQHTTSF